MVKTKQSISIDEELVAWLNSEIETKRFASISHGIEYALTVLKTPPHIKTKIHPTTEGTDIEIMTESSLSLEAMRNKWWDDKHIGLSIVKAGGIGIINLTNIIQKNPDLFETKEECRAWLHNKLKTNPPEIEIEAPKTSNKLRKGTIPNAAPTNTETIPSFTPNRSTIKCPGCGEEQLVITGSPVRKCANCGFNLSPETNTNLQPDQIAVAQDTPTPPPPEADT